MSTHGRGCWRLLVLLFKVERNCQFSSTNIKHEQKGKLWDRAPTQELTTEDEPVAQRATPDHRVWSHSPERGAVWLSPRLRWPQDARFYRSRRWSLPPSQLSPFHHTPSTRTAAGRHSQTPQRPAWGGGEGLLPQQGPNLTHTHHNKTGGKHEILE